MVQAEGLEAVFECLCPEATFYGWTINGTYLSILPADIDIDPPSGDSPTRLIIPATPQYNNTVVQCGALVREGGDLVFVPSGNATLSVQGIYIHLIQWMGIYFSAVITHKVLSILWLVSTIYWSNHQTQPSPSLGPLPFP